VYKIKLTYFKESGKYYTEDFYETDKLWMFEIIEEVKQMKEGQRLPGISGNEWIIHIEAEESHPNGYPCLIL